MDKELKKELDSVLQSIINGEVYAHIESVSNSGMSRRILFYRINLEDYKNASETDEGYIIYPRIENITYEIGLLSEELKEEQYKQGGKWVRESGLRVNGCGMDMIFNTLNNCIPYDDKEGKTKWQQRYNTL